MPPDDVNSPSSSELNPSGSEASTSAPAPQSTGSAPSSKGESQPSPGTREAEHQELLAAVQDVVKVDPDPIVGEPRPEDVREPPADRPSSPTEPSRQDDFLQTDPSESELSTYKPDTRKRIDQLLTQRNEARQASERYRADAEAYNQFRTYQTAHQLENDDVNGLMDAGAALRRGDFQGFLDRALPYIEIARQAVGASLPADLQEQVENGQIPYETAQELSMHRVQQARLQTEADTYRQSAQLTAQQATAQQIYGAVSDWEAGVKARDPDWAQKQDIVERFSQALVMSQGRPTSPQQAVAMAQKAYEDANQVIARGRPSLAPTRPQPSGVHTTTGNGSAAPEPRTLMEAAILGLQRGGQRMH